MAGIVAAWKRTTMSACSDNQSTILPSLRRPLGADDDNIGHF